MEDLILKYVVPFATLWGASMAATEWAPLPIGTVSLAPNKGTRKRWTSLIYTWALAVAGWHAQLIALPAETWWQAYLGAAVLSVVVASVSGALVALKKKTSARA